MRISKSSFLPKAPGKTKEALAELISDAIPGLTVYPEDLKRNMDSRLTIDVYKWEGYGTDEDRNHICLFSWFTMADLVKAGVEVKKENAYSYEIIPVSLTPTNKH